MIGTSLSHYEILDKLGEGGMGEVYRARDGKLGREVAIKVLPEIFAQSPERVARFQREAQLLASLNHPNIAAIHGLEEYEGKHYLVLELVPGETLADRIKGGPIPLKEAIPLARQIAKALDAAHEKGVIHRDLKPANVKITPDGDIKVLDFGLAKAFTEDESTPEPASSLSPTMSAGATRAGMILGTAAYMSPEQARGKQVDKRTDIFSFGTVLYEMLTGQKLFDGDEVSDILASVLKTEPDWEALPSDVTPRLRELLQRCLEKDRKRRRRDIGDVELELEQALSAPEPAVEASKPAAPRQLWPVVAGVAVVAALLGSAAGWLAKPDPPSPVTRFAHILPEGASFTYTGRRTIAISPSGSHIAYVSEGRLNLRALDSMEATELAGTDRSRTPFFSPDGQWIGFWADGIKKVAVAGGTPIELCEAENPFGASWTSNGTILFGQGADGILAVSENGGEPEQLVTVEESEQAYGPVLLPGGATLVFTLARADATWDAAQIVAQDIETGERTILVRGGSDARYLPTGHLLYAVRGTILAVPFDAANVKVLGPPAPVLEGVSRAFANTGAAHFDVSSTGTLAFIPGTASTGGQALNLVDRAGNAGPFTARRGSYRLPRLSHDESRLAVLRNEAGEDHIWILDRDRDAFSRLTDEGQNSYPVWSPDDSWIAFRSRRTDGRGIYRKRADFSGSSELLLDSEEPLIPTDWSQDGRWLVYLDLGGGNNDVWALPLEPEEGSREPRLVAKTVSVSPRARLSPDGRYVAYTSDESGQTEIYVQPFPGPGRRWQISSDGGEHPVWSRDGRALFYQDDNAMLSVPVETSPDFAPGVPVALFRRPTMMDEGFDVMRDGEHFVLVEEPSLTREGGPRVNVVLNWFEELERLAPLP